MNRKWWKAYFYLALTLTVFGITFPLFVDQSQKMAWWEWIYIPLYTVQIIGLFGFVFLRRLAVPLFWQFVFSASVVNEVWDLYSMATDPEIGSDYVDLLVSIVAVTLLLQVPLLIGLFLYGFRCKGLWRGTT
jgi:hypothetical protein